MSNHLNVVYQTEIDGDILVEECTTLQEVEDFVKKHNIAEVEYLVIQGQLIKPINRALFPSRKYWT